MFFIGYILKSTSASTLTKCVIVTPCITNLVLKKVSKKAHTIRARGKGDACLHFDEMSPYAYPESD